MTTDTAIAAAPRRTVPPFAIAAIAVLAIVTAALGLLYFQASRDLDGQKATVAALQTELASAKSDVAKEAARAAELKSDLNTAQTTAQSLVAKSTQLQSDIESKEQALTQEKSRTESVQAALEREKTRAPIVPVSIEMRRSAMGRGLVAVLTNTSAKHLPLLLAMQNPTTQATKRFSLQVAPGTKANFGYQEGWQFASGDRVLLRSAGFEDVQYTVP